MGIIFDLDQTLINSNEALELRRSRQWDRVYPMIPRLKPFSGVNELIQLLNDNSIPTCIVTTSPAPYCRRIVEHWKWQNVKMVCYHDTKNHKPYPDPILKGIQILGVDKSQIISIGDDSKDIVASKKAGVMSIGVTWGCTDVEKLKISQPDLLISNVEELRDFLIQKYNM